MSGSDAIRSRILALLGNQWVRLTPSALERELCRSRPDLSKKVARSAIKTMVADGALIYTNHFNTTHLELNFFRPIRVSDRIVLSPHTFDAMPSESIALVIKMDQGEAFGIGDHPTTRLSLRAVDFVMAEQSAKGGCKGLRALDIGTGSGVLAMAAVGLGAESAVGIDSDPAAVYEAARNIVLNGMDQQIRLTADPLESLADSRFNLVMANLRPPTLKMMIPMIEKLSAPEAYWVFSGCRDDALESVAAMLPPRRTTILWKEKSCGWAALAAVCAYQAPDP